MTTPQTLPLPLAPLTEHEHAWIIDSRHPTSEGVIAYVRCVSCGSRRVDLQTHPQQPMTALTRATVTP